jgi:pimeloyl-ACP methyl ester carboxylesterase
MNPLSTPLTNPTEADEALVEQALPGHGIPSQGAAREGDSVLVGGGVMAVGPAGVVVGTAQGAVAGALGGAAAGATTNPDKSSSPEIATTDAVRLYIDDSGGSGRPVVLVHGWPLQADAWDLQVSALCAAGYRVVTYDRRGFGRSDKPGSGYDYDTLADDLQRVMDQCGLQDVTLVGFSMGGGEVARYISRFGESRLHSVVFAAAVPPYLLKTNDNPEGPLTPETAQQNKKALERDRSAYFDRFISDFFSANGVLQVTELQRSDAIALCHQSAQHAALACMDSFGTTDFREDLKMVTVPTLVIHGDADAVVPIDGSGQRTHRAVRHSELVTVSGAPHGLNVSHAQTFNDALLSFLR